MSGIGGASSFGVNKTFNTPSIDFGGGSDYDAAIMPANDLPDFFNDGFSANQDLFNSDDLDSKFDFDFNKQGLLDTSDKKHIDSLAENFHSQYDQLKDEGDKQKLFASVLAKTPQGDKETVAKALFAFEPTDDGKNSFISDVRDENKNLGFEADKILLQNGIRSNTFKKSNAADGYNNVSAIDIKDGKAEKAGSKYKEKLLANDVKNDNINKKRRNETYTLLAKMSPEDRKGFMEGLLNDGSGKIDKAVIESYGGREEFNETFQKVGFRLDGDTIDSLKGNGTEKMVSEAQANLDELHKKPSNFKAEEVYNKDKDIYEKNYPQLDGLVKTEAAKLAGVDKSTSKQAIAKLMNKLSDPNAKFEVDGKTVELSYDERRYILDKVAEDFGYQHENHPEIIAQFNEAATQKMGRAYVHNVVDPGFFNDDYALVPVPGLDGDKIPSKAEADTKTAIFKKELKEKNAKTWKEIQAVTNSMTKITEILAKTATGIMQTVAQSRQAAYQQQMQGVAPFNPNLYLAQYNQAKNMYAGITSSWTAPLRNQVIAQDARRLA